MKQSRRSTLNKLCRVNRINIAKILVLTIGAVIFLFPLYWMFVTSLKTLPEIAAFPPIWWPDSPRWANYAEAWNYLPFSVSTKNTVIISACVVVGSVLSASFVGYGLHTMLFQEETCCFFSCSVQ